MPNLDPLKNAARELLRAHGTPDEVRYRHELAQAALVWAREELALPARDGEPTPDEPEPGADVDDLPPEG